MLVGLVQTGVYVRECWVGLVQTGVYVRECCAGGFGSDWGLCERVLVGLVQTGVYVRECWCWWVWFRLVFM